MAVSNVSIANGALSKIGAGQIVSFDDETAAARELTRRFDTIRDAELRRHVWSFAKARDSLAKLAEAPAFGFSYQYNLPADFLRLLSAGEFSPGLNLDEYRDSIDREDYTIEGRRILTDYDSPLKIRYIRQVTDPTQFDPAFVEALSARLAYELAIPLADSGPRKEEAWADYKQALREAARANAIEIPAKAVDDDTWLRGRL